MATGTVFCDMEPPLHLDMAKTTSRLPHAKSSRDGLKEGTAAGLV